jgi:4-amino-4-deoxy-L-arabinose transferase-like glycosyltransferase
LNAAATWVRALPGRYGRRTLIALAVIAVLGLGLRAYAVVHPVANPADDSHAYYALAKALYEEGSFGGPEFRDSSDWSPGAPLLYAASFFLTGGAREGTARIVEALMGTAAVLVVFALGARLARGGRRGLGARPSGVAPPGPEPVSPAARWTGLLAAFAVAVYPPFIHSTGELMSEPPAILTLPAAVFAFLWAGEKERWWAWLVPGLLFGLTAMFRPEYLFVAVVFVVLAGIMVRLREGRRGVRPALAGAAVLLIAMLVAIVPWTVRNLVVLERLVPISTGSGKALYVGTYLPADGEYQRVKAILYQRYTGKNLAPDSEALNDVSPTQLFDRVANEYKAEQGEPDLPRDSALGKLGRENFSEYFGEDPLGYLRMTARKVGRMWSSGVGEAMSSTPGRVVQLLLVFGGLAGFVVLGARRRWWELVSLATPIVIVTAVGATSLAAPRRNEVLMTLVFPLAALALSSAVSALSSRRAWSPPPSPSEASSQPN